MRRNVLLFALSLISSGFSYLAQVWLGRLMAPEDFSIYSSVMSSGLFATTLFGVVNLAVAKRVAELSKEPGRLRRFVRDTGLTLTSVAAGGAVLAMVIAPWIQRWLKLPGAAPILVFAFLFVFLVINLFYRSVLQGMGRYLEFAGVMCLQTLLFFCFIQFLPLFASDRPSWGFVAWIGSTWIALGVTWVLLRRDRALGVGASGNFRFTLPALRDVAGLGVATLIVTSFTSLDIVAAKLFFAPAEAGRYAGGAVIARIAFFLPGIFPSILFPEVVRLQAAGKGSFKQLVSMFGITACASGAFVLVAALQPAWTLTRLMGPTYAVSAPILGYLAAAMGIWALNNLFLHFYAAKGFYSGVLGNFGAGVVALAVVLPFGAGSPLALAQTWCGIAGVLLAFNLGFCAWVGRPKGR